MPNEEGVNEEVEQTTQESPAEAEQPEAEVQESSEESENINNDEAPKQNEAWAKMRVQQRELEEENAKLKSALEESGVDAEYLEQLREVSRQVPQQEPKQVNVSPDTDLSEVTGAINQTGQTAAAAFQEVQRLKQEIREREDSEALSQFPELSKDPMFEQMVAEKRLANEVMGRRVPTVEIARQVKKQLDYYRNQTQAETEQQTKERVQQKQTATAQPQTSTSGGQSSQADEELRNRVRKGDPTALTERNKDLIGDLFD